MQKSHSYSIDLHHKHSAPAGLLSSFPDTETVGSSPAGADLVSIYERLAPAYDTMHARWLRYAGGEAQSALEAAVRAFARPDATLLDAGAGTGAFARRLIGEGFAPEQVTLLDPASEMLRSCADLPCEKVRGRLEDMPFADGSFDIVTCAWALETVPETERAIAEMRRVLRQGGLLCLAFCAQHPPRGVVDWLLSQTLMLRGTGRFLSIPDVTGNIRAQGLSQIVSVPLTGPVAMVLAH